MTGLGEPPAESEAATANASETTQTQTQTPTPTAGENTTLAAQLFQSTGELREDYGEILDKAGLSEHASTIQRNNTIDNLLKAGLNATQLIGKKVDRFSPEEIAGMNPEARQALIGKLNQAPETPDGYSFEGEEFEGVHPEAGEFWGETLKNAGISQQQLGMLFPKMAEWQQKLTGDGQAMTETQQQQLVTANTQHFQAEWGDDYGTNKVLVEAQAEKDLDPENPVHIAFLQTKEGIQIMHERAIAQARALGEGSYPKGNNQNQGERPQQELARLQKENPNWRESPEIKNRMETLAKILQRQGA